MPCPKAVALVIRSIINAFIFIDDIIAGLLDCDLCFDCFVACVVDGLMCFLSAGRHRR